MPISDRAALEELRSWFVNEITSLSRDTYLLSSAVVNAMAIGTSVPALINAQFEASIKYFPRREGMRRLRDGKIDMNDDHIRARVKGLPQVIVNLLVVRLDALLHGFLDRFYFRPDDDDGQPLEADLGSLRAAADRNTRESYRLAIMLCVARNALVHNEGALNERGRRRLLDAGWTEPELANWPIFPGINSRRLSQLQGRREGRVQQAHPKTHSRDLISAIAGCVVGLH